MANTELLTLSLLEVTSYRLPVPLEQACIIPPLEQAGIIPPLPLQGRGMEWKLRTISDLSEARQQFVNTDETQAVRPRVAFLKCSAGQAVCVPSIFIRMVSRMIITKFSPCLVLCLTNIIFTAAL